MCDYKYTLSHLNLGNMCAIIQHNIILFISFIGECAVAALTMKRNVVAVDCDTTNCKSTLAMFCSTTTEATEE